MDLKIKIMQEITPRDRQTRDSGLFNNATI